MQAQPGDGAGYADDEIDLRELVQILWDGKWLILISTFCAAGLAAAYALLATPIYRAEATLTVAEDSGKAGGLGAAAQFAGLADLAGISMPGSKDRSVTLAMLKSRVVMERFIEEEQLLPALYEDYEKKRLAAGDDAEKLKRLPTVWDASERMRKGIFMVNDDKKSGLITVAIEWKDPRQAAAWVSQLVLRTNEQLRQQAIEDTEKNLAYIKEQAKSAPEVEIQQALFRLSETELKKLMMARGAREYALKTIDPARVPERKIKPKRMTIGVVGVLAGGFLGLLLVFLRKAFAQAPARSPAKPA